MTFAAFPLWAMLAMAGGAIASVLALYLLRRTPVPQVVSNVEFWLRAVQSARPKWLSSWRIPLIALLLSLLAALGIVMLLGDPRFGSGVRGTTIVVLDAGRSMDAVGVDGERRLDRAVLEVRRWVERTTITGEVAVVRAGMRPTVLLPITDDAADLQRALDSLELDDGPADLPAAIALADAILAEHGALEAGTGQILVVADRGVDVPTRAPVVALPVGTAAETVAITAFSARRVPEAVGEYAVRCEVSSFASHGATARVVIRDGDVTILDERVELAPRESVVLDAGGFSSARAELRAELRQIAIAGGRDGLASDDRAYAIVDALESTRVLLVSDGDRYLEAALASHPGLEVDVIAPPAIASIGTAQLARYHALVLDGAALPSGVEHGAVMMFAPPARGGIAIGAAVTRPRITATLASHPALDGLRLDGARIDRGTPIVEAAGDQVLIRRGGDALAVARQLPRGRIVAFGFDPADTDLVRGEGFPLMVHSA
nr:VWA domain-containing protein [Myxococcota bacterium]